MPIRNNSYIHRNIYSSSEHFYNPKSGQRLSKDVQTNSAGGPF